MKPQVWMQIIGQISIALGSNYAVLAQVVPDQTLPVRERSQVSGDLNSQVNGGAIRDSNLFHSFQQFSIPTNGSVFFNNPANIVNIITRVTGSNSSNIDGLIRANGTANLFLINPNGILFGANARLELGGSFLASTANSLKFVDGVEFDAKASQTAPLLTISAPIGLQYGTNPGEIRLARSATLKEPQAAILQVQNGQTLTLAGGTVNIDGGQLLAPGGRVELEGVSAAGTVELNRDRSLHFPESVARADVTLTSSTVNVRGAETGNAGNITISGQSISLTDTLLTASNIGKGDAGRISIKASNHASISDGSLITSNIGSASGVEASGNVGVIEIEGKSVSLNNDSQLQAGFYSGGKGEAGLISIKATDSVQMDNAALFANSEAGAAGDSSDIEISGRSISLNNGSYLDSGNAGEGNGGNINIEAKDSVLFDGKFSGAFSEIFGSGDGGNITITTGTLAVKNFARIVARNDGGQGNAGRITINAKDTVTIAGFPGNGDGTIANDVRNGGTGNANDLNITARSIYIKDDAIVAASIINGKGENGTLARSGNVNIKATEIVSISNNSVVFSEIGNTSVGEGGTINISAPIVSLEGASVNTQLRQGGQGRAGDINIFSTELFKVINGGQLATTTSGKGNAGSINVSASKKVIFDGVGNNRWAIQNSRLGINDGNPDNAGAFTTVESTAIGTAGGIFITAGSLEVTNSAQLSASSKGEGRAGNLDMNARQLRLDHRGSIVAQTTSGQGGDIRLQVPDFLLLRRGSSISTTAGTAQAGGDGGNITFDGNLIVAVPEENSNITANAFSGRGGNVRITTQGIFGIKPRPRETSLSDITARSDFGISGTIVLNTPDVDPSRGTATLPTGVIDPDALIASSCVARRSRQGRFIITGTGGLATQPDDLANAAFPTYELVPNPPKAENNTRPPQPSTSITEADQLYRLTTGEVVLGRSCD